jgi:uncharacterized protein HemY
VSRFATLSTVQPESQVALGYEALASGDWEAARGAFEEALDGGSEDPEALDGMGYEHSVSRSRGEFVLVDEPAE